MGKRWLARGMAIAAVAICGQSVLAAGIELPARKPGAWDIRVTPKMPPGLPQMAMHLCLDAATDKAIMERSLAFSEDCTMQQSRDGESIVIDSVCERNGGKQTAHTVISGDFQSAYTIEIVGDGTPSTHAQPTHTEITQQAQWLGECPADLKPGEVKLPSGQTINLLEALAKQGQ